tara:strand:+ start:67 stop:462 length:396 start_codon:yes stop_codon:yes gene_type:complete
MEFKITIILSHIENQSVEDMSLNAVNYIKEFIEDDELNIESIEDITELSSGADMLEQENAKLTNDIKMYQEKVGKLRRTMSEDMNVRFNNICIPKSYMIDESDEEVYDYEVMREMFEIELTNLKNKENGRK